MPAAILYISRNSYLKLIKLFWIEYISKKVRQQWQAAMRGNSYSSSPAGLSHSCCETTIRLFANAQVVQQKDWHSFLHLAIFVLFFGPFDIKHVVASAEESKHWTATHDNAKGAARFRAASSGFFSSEGKTDCNSMLYSTNIDVFENFRGINCWVPPGCGPGQTFDEKEDRQHCVCTCGAIRTAYSC